MNLALPALVILLAILPGVVLERAYYAGRFARRVAGITAGSEVALYILLAIPIDLVAIEASRLFGLVVDWPTVLLLLFGSLPEGAVDGLADSIRRDIKATATVYCCTVALSYAVGAILRRFVWATYLDTRLHILRMKNEWFYHLLGRRHDVKPGAVVFADVLTDHPQPEGSRLYRGIVSSFEPSESGGLQLLTLTAAKRGKGRGSSTFEWVDIPGDEFVILGSCVHSINLESVLVESDEDGNGVADDESRWSGFWRRFLRDEP